MPRSAAKGHGALPATGHALATPPSRPPGVGHCHLCPRAPAHPLDLTTAVLSSRPWTPAVPFTGPRPPTTLASLRLHQRFHRQGHLSEGVPHPQPASLGAETPSSRTTSPASGGRLGQVPSMSRLTTLPVLLPTVPWAPRGHTGRAGGDGGLGGGEGVEYLYKRQKNMFTSWGGAIFICCK